jgi:AcrR family transcriptional regulator
MGVVVAVVELGRRERKKQVVRDSIREETLDLVRRHGVEGTTIDAICDCVDIAKKTFYNYYSSKHDLLIDICQSLLMDRMEATITEALESDRDLAAQLDHIFAVIGQRNSAAGDLEKQLIEFMVSNLAVNPQEGAGQLTLMNEYYRRLFDRHREELRPGLSPEFCAEMTVGMSNAVTLNWLHQADYDAESRYRQLSDYLKTSMLTAH